MAKADGDLNIVIADLDHNEEESTSRVAWYYYHDGLTQNEIGSRLGISRVKVSRLLEKGRASGLIQVKINSKYSGCFALEAQLVKAFNLQEAIVIPELPSTDINDRLGQAAAQYLMNHLHRNDLLAIGWGDTVRKALYRLKFVFEQNEVSVVSLTGGVASYVNGMGLSHTGSRNGRNIHLIPAPILASTEAVAEALRDEPQIHSILTMAKTSNCALVGIGALTENATLVTSDYVSGSELLLYRRQGAVGDILGQFYDEHGKLLNLSIHNRIIGFPITDLAEIKCVIGVAGGPHKREAICGALAGNYINNLITDQETAQSILDSMKG